MVFDAFLAVVLSTQVADASPRIVFDLNAPQQQVRVSGVNKLTPTDLTISNLTTTDTLAPDQLSVTYDTETRTASVTFPVFPNGVLPDGHYRVTLGEHQIEFPILSGDLNADGIVDAQDFNVLSGNFGNVAVQYRHGDLNYDGTVDSKDVNIFTMQNGKRLPSTQPASQPSTQKGAETTD